MTNILWEQVLLNIKSPLAEVLKAYECKKQTVLSLITEKPQIMASTMAACLAELTSKVGHVLCPATK